MNHTSARRLAVLVLALLPFGLSAQNLPRPKEFYFESDADVARPLELYAGSDDATVERLLQARRNGRRDATLATAQLAHLSYVGGRPETGAACTGALQRPDNARPRDALYWNHGWDLYRSGDVAVAIEQWRSRRRALKGPAWLPRRSRSDCGSWTAATRRGAGTPPPSHRAGLVTTPDLQRLLPE